tara:strand:- start:1162 stop:1947 length:786 start_codon:yes stop_codon:yes gene_type:complete
MFKVLDLFAGIGGFTLGLERTGGFETVAFCEIEEYPQKVLKKNWPGIPIYPDVTKLTAEILEADGIRPDVITGGFPCQDISTAGKGAGIDGERSGLWSEIARLIGEVRPRYAIMENVSALLGRGLDRVLGDLAEIGYDAEWHCITAASVGAPHRRDRIWIVADANQPRLEGWLREGLQERAVEQPVGEGGTRPRGLSDLWLTEPDVGRVADGVPNRTHRLRCLGNAVVPQIPQLIGEAILKNEKEPPGTRKTEGPHQTWVS